MKDCRVILLLLWSVLFSLRSQAAVVLQYHHISTETPAATSLSPDAFAAHLAYLAKHDFQVIALPELVDRMVKGQSIPDKTVAITFDDGYRSVYTHAFPLLKKYGWPFTVFVHTQPIDARQDAFVSWAELNEMHREGASIGNHTVHHRHLVRHLDDETRIQWRQRIQYEIQHAHQRITAETGEQSRLLAYPYGEFDQEVLQIVEELDYIAFGQHSGPVSHNVSLQALPRFPFGGRYGSIEDFKIKVNSLPMPVEQVSVFSENGARVNDVVLPQGVTRPRLVVELSKRLSVNCFASGQGVIPVDQKQNMFSTKAPKGLPVGRSRYNCTASAAEQPGRYYWYSVPFIRRHVDGSWYRE